MYRSSKCWCTIYIKCTFLNITTDHIRRVLSTKQVAVFIKILEFKFGYKYCLFSLKLQITLLIFEEMSAKYVWIICQFFFVVKIIFHKKATSSIHSLKNLTTLWAVIFCEPSVLYTYFLFYTQNVKNVCVLRGQNNFFLSGILKRN